MYDERYAGPPAAAPAPGPAQGPAHPYQQPYQQASQQAYQQPPGPAHPYQQHPHSPTHRLPDIPEPAGDLRRLTAIAVDSVLLTGMLGFLSLGLRVADGRPFGAFWAAAIGCAVGVSFLNHVVLTRILGASVGKFLVRTRVILEKTGTRPRVPRLVKRWLAGYGFLVLWLIMALFDGEDDPEDLCGVRMVRRRDLLPS
ncbi:RDD family protein [Streptomyces sp. NPDC052496]|uniref:RDD family protein n=1 Tax=Streptomyces sp. NPDC052496 TaxID=3154951 RepID=UPI0034211126